MFFLYFLISIIICICFYSHCDKLQSEIINLKSKLERLNFRFERLNCEVRRMKESGLLIEEKPDDNQETEEIEIYDTSPAPDDTVENIIQADEYDEEISDETEQRQSTTDYRESSKSGDDFEKIFLGNIFNKIAAVAIIIGACLFIKLLSPFLTPVIKTIAGFMVGILMIVFGYNTKSEALKKYSEVLTGTGFSILFITVFCISALFDTFSPLTSSVIGGLILIFAYIAADNNKTSSMPVIALIGGYLNIWFVSGEVDTSYIFGYLIFLNILSVIFVYRNPSKSIINLINLIVTLFYLSIFKFLDLSETGIIYPVILWAVYIVSNFSEKRQYNELAQYIHWINLFVLYLFSAIIFNDAKTNIGILLLCVSSCYTFIVAYCLIKNREDVRIYVHSLMITVLLATCYLASNIYLVMALSIEAIITAFLIRSYNLSYLVNWIMVYIVASITSLFFVPNVIYTAAAYTPILNTRLYAFICPVLASIVSYLIYNQSHNIKIKNTANWFKFCFVSLIFVYLAFEINDFISYSMGSPSVKSAIFIKTMIFSIIAMLYSLQINKLAAVSKIEFLDTLSAVFYVLSLLLLLLYGHTYEPISRFIPIANTRFIAYAFAIGASIIFAKRKEMEFYKYFAALLGFALVHFEIKDMVNAFNFGEYLISVCWIIYASIITGFGMYNNKKFLKNCGIWLCLAAVIRIFLFDLANLDMIYKLISCITLGVIFMVISYYYNKNQQ